MNRSTEAFIAAQTARWNGIVAASWRWAYETATHAVFLHPRKGYRRVAKTRLGIA